MSHSPTTPVQRYSEAELAERRARGEQARASAALEGIDIPDAFIEEVHALERAGYSNDQIAALVAERYRSKTSVSVS